MKVDKTTTYEVHRPKELAAPGAQKLAQGFMDSRVRRRFDRSRQRAGTAGPLMVGDQISRLTGEQVDEVFGLGLTEGANPCYIDETNGHVRIGHFEFVPVPKE